MTPVLYERIGKRIRAARIMHGTMSHTLAEDIGVHRTTIIRYENGCIVVPNPARVFQIAEVLEVSAYWLMTGIGSACDDTARNTAIYALLAEMDGRVSPLAEH